MVARRVEQVIDSVPTLTLEPVRGRWNAKVSYYRELKSGNAEDVTLTFRDVDVYDLNCIARSLQGALDDIANMYDSLKKRMDVSSR